MHALKTTAAAPQSHSVCQAFPRARIAASLKHPIVAALTGLSASTASCRQHAMVAQAAGTGRQPAAVQPQQEQQQQQPTATRRIAVLECEDSERWKGYTESLWKAALWEAGDEWTIYQVRLLPHAAQAAISVAPWNACAMPTCSSNLLLTLHTAEPATNIHGRSAAASCRRRQRPLCSTHCWSAAATTVYMNATNGSRSCWWRCRSTLPPACASTAAASDARCAGPAPICQDSTVTHTAGLCVCVPLSCVCLCIGNHANHEHAATCRPAVVLTPLLQCMLW